MSKKNKLEKGHKKQNELEDVHLDRFKNDPKVTSYFSFDTIINHRINKTKELLLVKGKEYVRNNDRFHNFNRAAEMNRTTPTRALHGMLTKHLVSVMDILDDIDKGIMPTEAAINEKFGDVIVYMLLQEALIVQTIQKKA